MRNMNRITKGIAAIGAVLLMVALTGCGGGGTLVDTSPSGSGSGGNTGGGGSNNTPPGIPNSIVFAPPSSTNTVIALQGTGGKTNAEVTFQVNDASNSGVEGVPVTFALVPATGDATMTTSTGTTDANGKVSTFVVSGNEHYSVTVLATVSTPSGTKTAQSNSLTISTGIPTQGNFAIAVASLNAVNADNNLGVTDAVTVQLSDRFNNPAPDGTAVAFTANTGQIPGQCRTVGGSCTVTWTSSGDGVYNYSTHINGHVEILAYAVGEESFDDKDGDGIFDNSDGFTVYPGSGAGDNFLTGPGQNDIGEVYLDGDETGSYQSGEFFHDFNNDKVRNGPDGKFYGFGCKDTPTVPCGSLTTKEIGKQICIAASNNTATINTFLNGSVTPFTGSSVSVGALATLVFTVSDINGQALGPGTTVSLVQSGVNGFTINTPVNLPFLYPDVGCGADTRTFTVTITPVSPPPTTPLSGQILLEVLTPGTNGNQTETQVISLTP